MADTLDLGSSAERRGGSNPLLPMLDENACGNSSVVERFLAKEEVASSNLVSRFYISVIHVFVRKFRTVRFLLNCSIASPKGAET